MNKLCIVYWDDAWASTGGYYQEGNDYTPMKMMDVGWVMEENEDTVALCTSHSPDDGANRHIKVIPWKYITKYEEIVL